MTGGETRGPRNDTAGPRPAREMTVALLREPPQADHVEVAFFESSRFYRLPRAAAGFAAALERLRASQARGLRVRVATSEPEGDVLAAVDDPEAPGDGPRG